MSIKYQIINKFETLTSTTITVSGGTTDLSKSMVIPINLSLLPVDYSEQVQNIVSDEVQKSINPLFDAETTKYIFNNLSANSNQGLLLSFRFKNPNNNVYGTSYVNAGFSLSEMIAKRNSFKKSFFRLNFYDSNSGDTSNLIFTEDLNTINTATVNPSAVIPFNRLYWLRNDPFFINNPTQNKTVYMEAIFFNAKTGKQQKFINTILTTPLSISQYNNPSNIPWRTSPIKILNPYSNNGDYNFLPDTTTGANTLTTITFSEFIMA